MNYKLIIRDVRKGKNFTQKKLAKKIGISRSYLSDLENSKFDIKLGTLLKISVVLKTDINSLYKVKSK